MKQMTNEEYCLVSGMLCPYCKSKNIVGGGINNDGNVTWQQIRCNECNKRWNDIHSLVAYEECDNDGIVLSIQKHE